MKKRHIKRKESEFYEKNYGIFVCLYGANAGWSVTRYSYIVGNYIICVMIKNREMLLKKNFCKEVFLSTFCQCILFKFVFAIYTQVYIK